MTREMFGQMMDRLMPRTPVTGAEIAATPLATLMTVQLGRCWTEEADGSGWSGWRAGPVICALLAVRRGSR